MSLSVDNLNFTVFGREVKAGDWYDAQGNIYSFTLPKAKMGIAPGTQKYSGSSFYASDARANSFSDRVEMVSNWRTYDSTYGAANYQWLKNNDCLLMDNAENSNYLTPKGMGGLSVLSLMDLGLLSDSVPSSVTLYKERPLSDTYVTVSVSILVPDALSPANAPYDETKVPVHGANFKIFKHGRQLVDWTYTVGNIDTGFCELTKYDNTTGLGLIVKTANRTPFDGIATEIYTTQRALTYDNLFGEYETYFG